MKAENFYRDSEIYKSVPQSDFADCFERGCNIENKSALEIYLHLMESTPAWVEFLMRARNKFASLVGLKNLGDLGDAGKIKSNGVYKVGDQIGIFKLIYLSENEVILSDDDKHLEVKVSFAKVMMAAPHKIAVTTVVKNKNVMGWLYMLVVGPLHKIIVPATMSRAFASIS